MVLQKWECNTNDLPFQLLRKVISSSTHVGSNIYQYYSSILSLKSRNRHQAYINLDETAAEVQITRRRCDSDKLRERRNQRKRMKLRLGCDRKHISPIKETFIR